MMTLKIRKRVEKELKNYIRELDTSYSLSKISPVLYANIKEFISRQGKRIRPILFVIGYLGYAKKAAAGLYRSAVSIELLHDFMLVHDDIIDKSDTRRGRPSMHSMLNRYLSGNKNAKFNGEDLTIVIGDVMFALAMHAFLGIREDEKRKERALKKLIEAAIYTGSGEFIELLYGLKKLERITKEDIYRVYDYKTANYTFASPLAIGATLAGARQDEIDKLVKYGIYLGRAFQINDDILGMFGSEKKTGKSNLTDLKEAKKTILIWHAYKNSSPKTRLIIKRLLSKSNIGKSDLLRMRGILNCSGTLDYAAREIDALIKKAEFINKTLKMQPRYLNLLNSLSKEILSL
ncbi:MAG: polyprenyl synthetase family protein [Candidatus Omnitrophica bacterium]|nr:polyprenyl synthetase family protein [Candidatus Omnitrophota bacterium]